MGYQVRERAGLVVAEQSMDEQAVSRALKRIDDKLVLQKHPRDGVDGGWVYKVLRVWSDSHPAAVVLTWMTDQGVPLPLSSGILDEVQRHMVGARNSDVGRADEHNARLAERRERYARDESRAVADWYRPHLDRGRVGVSFADVSKKPLWARKQKGPVGR